LKDFVGWRKKWLVLVVFTLLTALFGCSMDKGELYDRDKEIAKEGDSYTFVGRIGNENKELIEFSFKKFSGVQTQWLIEAKENSEIELKYDTKIEKGDFKIVFVTPKQEVNIVAEQTDKGVQREKSK
jgi:hypothetical protein